MNLDPRIETFRQILAGSHIKRAFNEVRMWKTCVQVITPDAPTPYLNSILSGHLEETEIEDAIAVLMKPYDEANLPARWSMGPWTPVEKLQPKLETRGFAKRETTFGMVLENSDRLVEFVPHGFRLENISSENLAVWTDTEMKAWALPPQARPATERRGVTYLSDVAPAAYLALQDGVPVGVCGSRIFGNNMYLQGSAVLPEFRKQGFYRAMLGARVLESKAFQISTLYVNALSTSSAPTLEKLGFEKLCEIHHFFLERKNTSQKVQL